MLAVFGLIAGLGGLVRHIQITDFPVDMAVYRAGVREFLSGGELYSQPMAAGDILLPFIYPPFGALVLTPLTIGDLLTDDQAGNIMIVASGLLILLCLYLVFRALMKSYSTSAVWAVTAVAWALALLLEPVRLNASFAQINVVLMALVILDLVPRKRRLPQGWLIGVAAAIKIAPAAMLLYFLLRKDFRAIITAAVSGIVCTVAAALVRFDATWEYFTVVLLGMGTGSEFGVDSTYTSNSSLKGMVMRFFDTRAAMDNNGILLNAIWLLLFAAIIIGGSLLMLRLFRLGRHIDAWLVNAVIMLLISPVSWSHHWVWLGILLPVLAWRIFHAFPAGGARNFLAGLAAVWSVLVVTVPPKWWFGDGIDVFTLAVWQKILVSDFVWLGLLYLVGLWWVTRHTPPAPGLSAEDDKSLGNAAAAAPRRGE